MTQSLQSLMTDYSESLTRVDAEKDLMARIAQEAEIHHRVKPATFKKVAAAFHKDKAKNTRDDLQEQVDLFDQLIS
jgi:hypothetical protein